MFKGIKSSFNSKIAVPFALAGSMLATSLQAQEQDTTKTPNTDTELKIDSTQINTLQKQLDILKAQMDSMRLQNNIQENILKDTVPALEQQPLNSFNSKETLKDKESTENPDINVKKAERQLARKQKRDEKKQARKNKPLPPNVRFYDRAYAGIGAGAGALFDSNDTTSIRELQLNFTPRFNFIKNNRALLGLKPTTFYSRKRSIHDGTLVNHQLAGGLELSARFAGIARPYITGYTAGNLNQNDFDIENIDETLKKVKSNFGAIVGVRLYTKRGATFDANADIGRLRELTNQNNQQGLEEFGRTILGGMFRIPLGR